MDERHLIPLNLSAVDKLIELLSGISLLSIWTIVIINYHKLPDIIPIHYSEKGIADGYGKKYYIFLMPVITRLLFLGLSYANKFPHIFNYPVKITRENAERQYINATRLIRYLKIIVIVIFGITTIQTINDAKGQQQGLGIWFLPFIIVLIFYTFSIFYYPFYQRKIIINKLEQCISNTLIII